MEIANFSEDEIMEFRELIEEKGRLEVIGRPRLFGTTQNFLRTFGITSLSELPSLDLFNVEG